MEEKTKCIQIGENTHMKLKKIAFKKNTTMRVVVEENIRKIKIKK